MQMQMNPMLLAANQNKINAIQSAYSAMQTASNPQLLFNQILMQIPNAREAMQIIQQHGGDQQKAYLETAKQYGVDPNFALQFLR